MRATRGKFYDTGSEDSYAVEKNIRASFFDNAFFSRIRYHCSLSHSCYFDYETNIIWILICIYIYIYILGLNLKKRTRENFGRTKDRWNFNISINVEGVNNSKLISLSLLNWTCAKRKMMCFQVCRFKLEIFKFKIEKKKKKEMNLHK